MSFNGAVNKSGVEIGVVLIVPNGEQLWISKRLHFPTTNNVTEYEACIYRLEALIMVGAKKVEVTGNSLLIISHIQEEWEDKEDRLRLYYSMLSNCCKTSN